MDELRFEMNRLNLLEDFEEEEEEGNVNDYLDERGYPSEEYEEYEEEYGYQYDETLPTVFVGGNVFLGNNEINNENIIYEQSPIQQYELPKDNIVVDKKHLPEFTDSGIPEGDVQISDFFGEYPDITDEFFNSYIQRKQEFLENKAQIKENIPKIGKAFNRQKYVSNYYMHYKRGLIVDEPGTGKTCLFTQISEAYKYLYQQNPNDPSAIERVIILCKSKTQALSIIDQIYCRCTNKVYETPDILHASDEKKVKAAIRKSIKRWYSVYTYGSFLGLLKKITSEDLLQRFMSNKIFVCDEAHNMVTMKDIIKTESGIISDEFNNPDGDNAYEMPEDYNEDNSYEDTKLTNYNLFHKFFHMGSNNIILLFTATPIINNITEFVLLMNLILASDNQMHKYSSEELRNIKFEDIEVYLRGKVSWVRALDTSTVSILQTNPEDDRNKPEEEWGKVINILSPNRDEYLTGKFYLCGMSDFQYEIYNQSRGKSGVYVKESQALDLVYPDGSIGSAGLNKYYEVKQKRVNEKGNPIGPVHMKLKNDANGNELARYFSNLNLLKEISCKAYEMVNICLNAWADSDVNVPDDKGIVFIYIPGVNGSGAIDIATILTYHGYELFENTVGLFQSKVGGVTACPTTFTSNKEREGVEKRKRVALFTTATSSQSQAIFDTLNSKENRYGRYLQVLIVSEIGEEGINVYNAVAYVNYTPSWNPARKKQSERRIFRAVSHVERLKDLREKFIDNGLDPNLAVFPVKVYYMVGVYFGNEEREEDYNTIDVLKHSLIESKSRDEKIIQRHIKRADYACQINYSRNVRASDVDFSEECDYQLCNYECSGIDRNLMESIDWKTKLMYFSREETEEAEFQIRSLFRLNSSMNIKEITEINKNIKPVFIYMALDKMLRENKAIIDKLGFKTYMRISGDIIYLDKDEFSSNDNAENVVYTENIIGTQNQKRNIFEEYSYNKSIIDDQKNIINLIGLDVEHPNFMDRFESLAFISKVMLIEAILYNTINNERSNPFNNKIISEYSNVIYKIHEPVNMLKVKEHEINTTITKRGRRPNIDKAVKIKKIEPTFEIPSDVTGEVVYLHTILNYAPKRTKYALLSKFFKAEGRTRILKMSEKIGWRDVNEAEYHVYNKLIQKLINNVKTYYDKFGIYGIIHPMQKDFSIRDVNMNEDSNDSKKQKNGRICKSWLKIDLIDVLYRLGLELNMEIRDSLEYMKNIIKNELQKDANKVDDITIFPHNKIINYYKWIKSDYKVDDLCKIIKGYLEETGRVFTGRIPKDVQLKARQPDIINFEENIGEEGEENEEGEGEDEEEGEEDENEE